MAPLEAEEMFGNVVSICLSQQTFKATQPPEGQIGWNRVNPILAPCLGENFLFNKEFAMTEDDTTITRRRLGGCC